MSDKSFEFFVGKVSPFLLFDTEYHSLFYVVQNHKEDKHYPEINPASQVATIGLLAYFEAFCKHQFAAIVNLFPSLTTGFASKRGEPKIEFSTIIALQGKLEENLGFLLAENYDFGTAKAINGLFRDLLSVTPFSQDEEVFFNEIVYKRNLLVHHGGFYTLQYLKREALSEELRAKVYKEAVKIDTEQFEETSDFLFEMAKKLTYQTVKAVRQRSEYKSLSEGDIKVHAIEQLLQGLWDTLDDHECH